MEEILQYKVWFYEFGEPIRLTGISIKLDAQGLLCILRARTAEGPKVAFVGARGFWALVIKLRDPKAREAISWRFDAYALDNLEKKE